MNSLACIALLSAASWACQAAPDYDCFAEEVADHVVGQLAKYGPLSKDREYFGYLYRARGVIYSAVARGPRCQPQQSCEVNTARSAALIPSGARILGEWHTHPHINGSARLSDADVRGVNANRHIHCYHAFFATADGDILSWDRNETTVAAAMRSALSLGNYRDRVLPTLAGAQHAATD